MLTLTENASTVVKTLTARGGTDESGLRISSQSPESGAFAVEVASAPQTADTVVETEGARVFLEPNAAEELADKVLDADVSAEGGVRFTITEQPAG